MKQEKEAKWMVTTAFWNAPGPRWPDGIRLHIDDGQMGGGTSIPFVWSIIFSQGSQWLDTNGDGIIDTMLPHNQIDEDRDGTPDAPGTSDDFYDFKYGEDNNFDGILDLGEDRNGNGIIDSYFSHSRNHIFHYCLFAVHAESWYENKWYKMAIGWGELCGDDMIIATFSMGDTTVFMHELGHNLWLNHSSWGSVMDPDDTFHIDYHDWEWDRLVLLGIRTGSGD